MRTARLRSVEGDILTRFEDLVVDMGRQKPRRDIGKEAGRGLKLVHNVGRRS